MLPTLISICVFAQEMKEILFWLNSVLLENRRDDRPLVNIFLSSTCQPIYLFLNIHNLLSQCLNNTQQGKSDKLNLCHLFSNCIRLSSLGFDWNQSCIFQRLFVRVLLCLLCNEVFWEFSGVVCLFLWVDSFCIIEFLV